MITLIVDGQLNGLNEYTYANRGNKYGGAAMKHHNENIVKNYIRMQIPDVHFEEPVKLSFRWYEPNRKRDLDNICFAKKFILDALVQAGTLKTDSWRGVVGFTDEFFVDKENRRIEVDIETVKGE